LWAAQAVSSPHPPEGLPGQRSPQKPAPQKVKLRERWNGWGRIARLLLCVPAAKSFLLRGIHSTGTNQKSAPLDG
jgi:hypothetical protein